MSLFHFIRDTSQDIIVIASVVDNHQHQHHHPHHLQCVIIENPQNFMLNINASMVDFVFIHFFFPGVLLWHQFVVVVAVTNPHYTFLPPKKKGCTGADADEDDKAVVRRMFSILRNAMNKMLTKHHWSLEKLHLFRFSFQQIFPMTSYFRDMHLEGWFAGKFK